MALYRFGPIVVATCEALPELPLAAPDAIADCEFSVEAASAPLEEIPWYHHHLFPDGEIGISLGKNDLGFLMRFDETVDFHVSPDGRKIRCIPSKPELQPGVRHLLLNHVLPLSLSLRGYLTLHAGAVAIAHAGPEPGVQRGIAFLGRTGAGKSTLTAAFMAHGCPLISEDCLILKEEEEGLSAIPTYPILRMRPETWEHFREDRRLVPASAVEQIAAAGSLKRALVGEAMGVRMAAGPLPFERLYLLEPDAPRLEITPLPAREAFLSVVQHSFLLDLVSRDALTERFHHAALLVGAKTWRLRIPRKLNELPAVVEAVIRHLTRG